MTTDNDDNSRETKSGLKEVILDLFEQVRQANALNAEKDRMIASLTEKLDAVLKNQRQQKLDLKSWLAKERRWNKECESLLKTIKDLNDIVKTSSERKSNNLITSGFNLRNLGSRLFGGFP
ncbi:MAG: hypothetical protein K2M17_04745 [Bacilli bacterium]|nr:hypothetical protein [Bacilli bacterium]